MNKKIMMIVFVSLLSVGCSNTKQITVGSAVGGTAGALVGGMIGGMFGLLATGAGAAKHSDAILAASVILGGVTGGAAGATLGGGIQSAVEK